MLTTQVVSSKVDWSRAAEALLVAVLAGLVFAVHDVPWVLSEPFWNDENWVVVSTRLPLADVPSHTSTTPIGFTLLLRTIRWGGDERFRLLPLLFSSASVVAAYALARAAGWRDRREAVLAGVLAGGAALLVPTALFRNDLKQYTAEAFAALFVLVLCARVERDRSPRSLAVLAGGAIAAKLVSHSVVFVAAAAFASLLVVAAARRDWRFASHTLVAGAVAASGMAAVYLAFDRKGDAAGLAAFWKGDFPPTDQGLEGVREYLATRWSELDGYLGLGGPLLTGCLVATGLVTLARRSLPAVALAVLLLPLELLVAGLLEQYPLLELRTSHFLLVTLAVTAAIGVAGLMSVIARVSVAASVAFAVGVAALYVAGSWSEVRGHTSIPASDVPSQVDFVEAQRRPGDVLVVNRNGSFGFGYYWQADSPRAVKNETVLQGWTIGYPDSSRILVAPTSRFAAIESTVEEARRLARAHNGRVWVVRTFSLLEVWEPALVDGAYAELKVGGETLFVMHPDYPVEARLTSDSVRSVSGTDLSLSDGRVPGNVEAVATKGRRVVVGGWAAAPGGRAMADWVLAFSDGRLVAAAPPSIERPDVAESRGDGARIAGFVLTSPRSRVRAPSHLRVVAVAAGEASELPRSDTGS